MSVFLEILKQYEETDAVFEQALVRAYNAIDELEFDRADTARSRNDQAYFLFLFTRLEDAVNSAFKELLDVKATGIWQDNRAWIVWKGHDLTDIYLMTKVELLAEKGASDCEEIRRLYKDRNLMGTAENGSRYCPSLL